MFTPQQTQGRLTNEEPVLDFITDSIITDSPVDEVTKDIYQLLLHQIEQKIDPTKPFGEAEWLAFDEWRKLSDDFYKLVGIEGQVVAAWTMESRMNEMGTALEDMSINGKSEMASLEERMDLLIASLRQRLDV